MAPGDPRDAEQRASRHARLAPSSLLVLPSSRTHADCLMPQTRAWFPDQHFHPVMVSAQTEACRHRNQARVADGSLRASRVGCGGGALFGDLSPQPPRHRPEMPVDDVRSELGPLRGQTRPTRKYTLLSLLSAGGSRPGDLRVPQPRPVPGSAHIRPVGCEACWVRGEVVKGVLTARQGPGAGGPLCVEPPTPGLWEPHRRTRCRVTGGSRLLADTVRRAANC